MFKAHRYRLLMASDGFRYVYKSNLVDLVACVANGVGMEEMSVVSAISAILKLDS